MSNVLLTWTLPVPNNRQRPIKHVRIETRDAEDLPWTSQDVVTPEAEQKMLFADEAAGTHFYRAVVVDDLDQESPKPQTGSVSIGWDLPSEVTTFTVELV